MRRQLWLATDAAYKRAVNVFARKKAAFQNRTSTDALPDFSKEAPVETVLPPVAPGGSNREWLDGIRQISAVFASSTDIHSSEVSLTETHGTRYFVNSEGFKTVSPIQSASLRVSADTQAADGTQLRDSFGIVEKRTQDLPPVAALVARTRDLATRLTARRDAPIGEDYTGPVLIEGEASVDLVTQSLDAVDAGAPGAGRRQPAGRPGGAEPDHAVSHPHRTARPARCVFGQRYAVARAVRR